MNRQQNLSGSFKLLWILSCCTYLGSKPAHWMKQATPTHLLNETGVPLSPFDETEYPCTPPHWMKQGYPLPPYWINHACSAVCMEAGPLETCTGGASFHCHKYSFSCLVISHFLLLVSLKTKRALRVKHILQLNKSLTTNSPRPPWSVALIRNNASADPRRCQGWSLFSFLFTGIIY